MFEKIQKIIAEQLDVDPAKITPETDLIDDLQADSLDVVSMVMELETQCGIQLEDDELMGLKTVQDFLDLVEKRN